MKPVYIILTVPHAKCYKDKDCDKTAEKVARILRKKLKNVSLIVGDKNRNVECDLNRYEFCHIERKQTRKTDFRIKIRKEIEQKKNKDYRILVLDIHSYTEKKLKWTRKQVPKEIYVLDNYYGYNFYKVRKFSYIVHHFSSFMNADVYPGKLKHNDIMDEMNELNIDNFLIEFNENLTKPKIHEITSNISNWVKSYYSTKLVSPISGVIREIYDTENKIGIYIRGPNDFIQDDHDIYAPENGKVSVESFFGNLSGISFISDQNKQGYLKFKMKNISFDVIVGAGYVTDNINLEFDLSKHDVIRIGQKIGEIVIKKHNSYCYLYLKDTSQFKLNVILKGGESSLI